MPREQAKRWAREVARLDVGAPWEQARPWAQEIPGLMWAWGSSHPAEAWAFCVRVGAAPHTIGEALAAGFGYWGWCAGKRAAIPFFSLVEKVQGAPFTWKVQSSFDLPRHWPMAEPFEELRGFARDALSQAYARMDWSVVGAGRAEGIDTAPLAWARWRPDPDDFAGLDWRKLSAAVLSAMEPAELSQAASQGADGCPKAPRL